MTLPKIAAPVFAFLMIVAIPFVMQLNPVWIGVMFISIIGYLRSGRQELGPYEADVHFDIGLEATAYDPTGKPVVISELNDNKKNKSYRLVHNF